MSKIPLIIGHRGASTQAPENTLAAFQLAIDQGADGVEFDVQLSADGVPVVIHDYDLQRTGGRDSKVSDLTSRELGRIDVGSWFNKKHKSHARDEFATERVPTLAQVLDLLKSTDGPIYIELKCETGEYKSLVGAVCELIRDSPQLDRIIIKSFRLAVIPDVKCQLPSVKTAALFEPSIMTILRRRLNIIEIAREFGADQISLHYSLASEKFAAAASEANMPVTIWTVDKPKWLKKCKTRGIGSIITNDPQLMLAAANNPENKQ